MVVQRMKYNGGAGMGKQTYKGNGQAMASARERLKNGFGADAGLKQLRFGDVHSPKQTKATYEKIARGLEEDARFAELAKAAGKRVYPMKEPMSEDVPVAALAKKMADGKFGLEDLKALGVQIVGREVGKGKGGSVMLVAADANVWASEIIFAHQMLATAGYKVKLFTPSGKAPQFLEPSTIEGFRDLPRNAIEVTPGEAALAKKYMTPGTPENAWMNSAQPLSKAMPEEAYPQESLDPKYGGKPEVMVARYVKSVNEAQKKLKGYDAVYVGGGAGGFTLHQANLELVLSTFAGMKKPIIVNCYGANPAAHATMADGRSILDGHKMAVHTNTHDWKNRPEIGQPYGPPFSLQQMVEGGAGRGGGVVAKPMNHMVSSYSENGFGETVISAASTHDAPAAIAMFLDKNENPNEPRLKQSISVDLGKARKITRNDMATKISAPVATEPTAETKKLQKFLAENQNRIWK